MRNFLIILFFTSLTFSSFSQNNSQRNSTIKSAYLEKELSDFLYNSDNDFYYKLAYDTENILIDIKFVSNTIITKFLRSGLTTWIDIKSKSKKDFGISLEGNAELFRDQQIRIQGLNGAERVAYLKLMLGQINYFKISGKSIPEEYYVSMKRTTGIRGSLSFDEASVLNYKIIVPFAELYKNGDDSKKLISIGFSSEQNSNQKPEQRQAGMSPGSQRQGGGTPGMGKGGGGGGGGGGRGGSKMNQSGNTENPRQGSSSFSEFWIKKIALELE